MEFASPRWGAYDDTKPLRASTTPNATYAVSAQYAAYANRRGVFARKLATSEHYKRLFRYEDDRPWFQPVLSFSTVRGRLLAIATGVQILVFDVDTKKVKHALKGNGRIITSLAWAESKPGILATGAVDGSICVWSLKHPARPLYHVRAFHGACNHVAFHPNKQELLAGCHEDCISVWALPSTKPFLVTKSKDSDFTALRWFATDPLRVLGISSAGSVSIYDVHSALKTFRDTPSRRLDDSDDEQTMFGKLEDIGYMPASDFSLGMNISQAMLIGRNGLIVLPRDGHILFFITFFADKDEATELWRLRLDDLIDCFSLRVRDRTVQVVACMGAETQSYEVPGTVLDGMGWNFATSTSGQYGGDAGQERMDVEGRSMRPELHIYGRMSQSPLPSTKASEPSRATVKPDSDSTKRPQSPLASRSKSTFSAIPLPSMTSSLELPNPKGQDEEQDSPMPFLSPSIPARRTSLCRAITPLDDSMRLPPRASFDSITSTAGHDSDSDDETFADHLQGSGSYLPGGVNVPLPRTCGASFGANGQLVIFLPIRAQPTSMNSSIVMEIPETRERQNSTVTRLFPNFGNLGFRVSAPWSTSDSGSSPEKHTRYAAHRFSVPTSSFGNNTPWSTRVSPVKSTTNGLAHQQTVKVTVVKTLQSAQQLAYNYRILPTEDESVSELCFQNATFAEEASMKEAAKMWRMLAVLLEQKSCNVSDVRMRDAITTSCSKRPVLSRNISLASTHGERALREDTITLDWLHHPMGRNWAMDKILSWAESQADVQLLACVSSLLVRVSEDLRIESIKRSLPDTLDDGFHGLRGTNVATSIPLLRTDTNITDVSFLDDSPVKPYSSRTSSRDPSLPTTPYIDSSASTPPLTLPPLNRHTTRLSASGSASPEAHRGSFSATAKYYAQTLSDKLAGYSTSPPTRRLGGSPGNELSTSLPTAAGSWSKSVSFAAGSDTAHDSRQSLSLAQEDDNYDSDRTIDEMSLPRTPNLNPGVVLRELNGQRFCDYEPVAPSFSISLLPGHLATKSSVWRDSYAEQLRSWDLIIEAAELENVSDLAGALPYITKELPRNKVVPHMDPECRGVTCCICSCAIKAAKQLCPACLHTTHKHCLEDFVAALQEDDADFTCPAGCGCECAAAEDISYRIEDDQRLEELAPVESPHVLQSHFAKKRSLTDPRLLKDRLEGNSW